MIGSLIAAVTLTLAAQDAGGAADRSDCLACARVEAFYAHRAGAPAWTGPGTEGRLDALRSAIAASASHGLAPETYHLTALQQVDPDRANLHAERLATDAYIGLAAHLLAGRLNPETLGSDWHAVRRDHDLIGHLEAALANGFISESLTALAPSHPGYAALRKALDRYQALSTEPAQIEDGPDLLFGDRAATVARLRARLAWLGYDVDRPGAPSKRFGAALDKAVRAFQRDHGLASDGVIGIETRTALNRSQQARIDQVRANLERWRWLPEYFGGRYLWVSVPEFRLSAMEYGRQARTHPIIVGRQSRPTPVFSASVRYLVLNPWWETPMSLAVRDELPLFRRDPEAFDRLGFVALDRWSGVPVEGATIDWDVVPANPFPYRLRQAPGPQNALGQVKLIVDSRFSVHLHDTPARHLFDEPRRAFSSGCIRVRDALDLAAWAAESTPDWDRGKILEVVESGEETRVDLADPIDVHVVYHTARRVGLYGVRFIPDLYGRDGGVIRAMQAGVAPLETRNDFADLDDSADCPALEFQSGGF